MCGKETKNKVYCGEACQYIGSRAIKIDRDSRNCTYCEVAFVIIKTKKNKYCSRNCVDKHKKQLMIGNKNGANQTQEANKKRSVDMKKLWQDSKYVKQVLAGRDEFLKTSSYPAGCDPDSLDKKRKSTKEMSIIKYGTEHPFQSKEYREASEQSCMVKYGKTSLSLARESITKDTIEKRRRSLIESVYNIQYEDYEQLLEKKDIYYKQVLRITNQQPLELLDGYDKRGRCDLKEDAYHLDHIIPIAHGFKNNIPPETIGDISNLRFLFWKENITKGGKLEEN